MYTDTFQHKGQRLQLIAGLRAKGIRDENVLEAMADIPRHLFMDPGLADFAYVDSAYPIQAGQTISQPFTVARQSELLEALEGMKVLEIGTGSGYQAAVLYRMKVRVFSIERQKALHEFAMQNLSRLNYHPQLFFGDGYKGLPTYGPFHRILLTAAPPEIPDALKKQLVIGGMMVLPLGQGSGQIMTRLTRVGPEEFEIEEFGHYSFVPMVPGTTRT